MSVAVIGAGGWGTALAKLLCEKGEPVTLWCREDHVRRTIEEGNVNERFLPDVELPSRLRATGELSEAPRGAEIVLLAVPSAHFRSITEGLASSVESGQRFVSATKGIEEGTHLRMSQVLADVLPFSPDTVAVSGPSFAREVAGGEPTAVVAAGAEGTARLVQSRFSTDSFRVYTNDDIVGVELGGALKNVIALAVGVATGLGLGSNPAALLMTRGLAEISRLAQAMGGRRETLAGLAGMGDLVLTCTGRLSRNRRVGIELGRGSSLNDILATMQQVAEGVQTTFAAAELARVHGVDMPIVFQMECLLKGDTSPRDVMGALMTRPLSAEF